MLIEQTIEKLRKLKLGAMVSVLEEQLSKPDLQALTFNERLGLMVDHEVTERENRRVSSLLRKARLRQNACVEDLNYRHARGLVRAKMAALVTCDFIHHHQNILFTGPTGCGKSWLACALGQAACRKGFSTRYLRVSRLLESLRIAHADGSYEKLLSQIAKIDLLILDDFGMHKFCDSDRKDLFEIIEDRHKLKSTIVTSQLPIKNWHENIGEPTIADAILDRLLSNSHKIELKGESMRKDQKLDLP